MSFSDQCRIIWCSEFIENVSRGITVVKASSPPSPRISYFAPFSDLMNTFFLSIRISGKAWTYSGSSGAGVIRFSIPDMHASSSQHPCCPNPSDGGRDITPYYFPVAE